MFFLFNLIFTGVRKGKTPCVPSGVTFSEHEVLVGVTDALSKLGGGVSRSWGE